MATSEEKDLLSEIHRARMAVSQIFTSKWGESEENARFYRMKQYSESQLQSFDSQDRVPYIFDHTTVPISTTLGDQRDQRTDIVYLPTKDEDALRVELANSVKESLLRNNDFVWRESDVFQDGVIEKTGALGFEWAKGSKPEGELRMFRVPPRQLCWDLNNREPDIEQCGWVSRSRMYLKKDLEQKYPDFKKEIGKLAFSTSDLDGLNLDSSYMKQLLHENQKGCLAIEYYEKEYANHYFIYNADTHEYSPQYWSTRKDCEKAIKDELQRFEQTWLDKVKTMVGMQVPAMPKPNLQVFVHQAECVYKSEIAQNIVLLNKEKQDYPFFPFSKYHPYWHDGEWWAMMDLFKDPQRFINKMASLIDNQINKSGKGLLIIDESIPKLKAREIRDNWGKTGGAVDGVPNADKTIKFFESKGFDPRFLSAMELAIANIEKKAGGQNFMGQKESSNEAASAIRQRILRASASSFVMFDNFSRWKNDVGEKLLWYISNYVTTPQKVRIEGADLTKIAQEQFPNWFKPSLREGIGFLSINTSEDNSLQGLDADVVVSESKHSATKNQAVLMQLSMALQSSPVLAETISPIMLIELLDVDASVKQKWLAMTKQMMQAKSQNDKANKAPSLSATLKDIGMLPPDAQVQFAQQFGIELQEPVTDMSQEKNAGLQFIKQEHDKEKQDKELALKYKKHQDQTMMKAASEQAKYELELEKINLQKGKDSEEDSDIETGS